MHFNIDFLNLQDNWDDEEEEKEEKPEQSKK